MLDPQSPTARRRESPPDSSGEPTPSALQPALRAVIDPLPEPIFVTDAAGQIRLTNGAADQLFAGNPVRTDADLLSRFEEFQRRESDEPSGDREQRTVRPRHRPNTWYSLDRVPLAATEDDGAAIVLRDISNSGDLRAEREAFLEVLSHEMRTPLTTIYAGSSVLARRPRLSGSATRTLAMDISLEAARLYDLVENLLVIARLERQILHPLDEPVDLGRAMDTAIGLASYRVPDVRIIREGPATAPPVHGDATYVAQACRNLILSMLRVPSAGSASELIVRLGVDRPAEEVALTVLDDGPSLSTAELEQAFDLPASSPTGRLAAVGMGPFVARHAIEAMGGRTWAREREGGGLEMGFALRIHEGSRRRARAKAAT